MVQIKNVTKLVLLSNVLLYAEIDMQTAVYDSAEEMMRFDEKMNRMIEEHNGQIFEDEEMEIFENRIEDFEELKDGYILERKINNSKNTKIELSLKNRMLTISAEASKKEKIIQGNMTSYETTISNSKVSLFLPNDADENSMVNSYKNGILTIKFRKKK